MRCLPEAKVIYHFRPHVVALVISEGLSLIAYSRWERPLASVYIMSPSICPHLRCALCMFMLSVLKGLLLLMFEISSRHDDVIKWKHFGFTGLRGIHRSPGNFPHKGQWRGALIFFICAWINGWLNNREAADLRRHRAHYDATVMDKYAM